MEVISPSSTVIYQNFSSFLEIHLAILKRKCISVDTSSSGPFKPVSCLTPLTKAIFRLQEMEPMQPTSQKSSNMQSISSPILSEIHLMGLLGSGEALLEQPSHRDSKRSKAKVGFKGVHSVWKDPGLVKWKDTGEAGNKHKKKYVSSIHICNNNTLTFSASWVIRTINVCEKGLLRKCLLNYFRKKGHPCAFSKVFYLSCFPK